MPWLKAKGSCPTHPPYTLIIQVKKQCVCEENRNPLDTKECKIKTSFFMMMMMMKMIMVMVFILTVWILVAMAVVMVMVRMIV